MKRLSEGQTCWGAIISGALLLQLLLGACAGDDAGSTTGASGNSSAAGANLGGLSIGAASGSGASSNQGATTSSAGAGGADDTATGGTTAGSVTGGSATGGGNVGGSNLYLPCESLADCKAFGGGKVCCVAGSMHFCTKPSGCSGDTLP